jgi:hypothetical protein
LEGANKLLLVVYIFGGPLYFKWQSSTCYSSQYPLDPFMLGHVFSGTVDLDRLRLISMI